MASVEEPRLGIDACLLLQGRNGERAVDQEERRDGRGRQIRVPAPQAREGDAESREDEVGREAVAGEEPCLAQRVPAREVEHRREEDVVHDDEDDTGGEAGDRHRRPRASPRSRTSALPTRRPARSSV